MKHSARMQKRYDDKWCLAHKKSKALNLLEAQAKIGYKFSVTRTATKYLPMQGEFVALVAANCTKIVPKVFVAEVFSLSKD